MSTHDLSDETVSPVPFASLDWSASLLRRLERAFEALEQRATRLPTSGRIHLHSPSSDLLRLELHASSPVLYLLDPRREEAPPRRLTSRPLCDRGWLRLWRTPGDRFAPRDVARLREAGLEPCSDGVCLPERRLPSLEWRTPCERDLHRLAAATEWSVCVLDDTERRVA